ncbi:hypothetical protein D3C77_293000 [compost metagenome]
MSDSFLHDHLQSRELFSYFGLAVYYSQALEQQMANFIILIKVAAGDMSSEEQLKENFEKKLSNSLGQLVREISHYFTFPEDEMDLLRHIWKMRNFIVHDYFKQKIHATFTEEGRVSMINELKQFCEDAAKLQALLQRHTHQLYNQIDLKEE